MPYILLLLLVTAIWGVSFLVVKDLINDGVPLYTMLTFRFFVGSLFLFLCKKALKIGKISKEEFRQGIIVGVVIFISFALQTAGAIYTTPGKNGMLTGLYVLFVPLIIFIQYGKFTVKSLFDAFLCLFGLALFFDVFRSMTTINLGDILTIGCALFFAIQFIVLERQAPRLNPWNYTIVQLLTVGVLGGIFSVLYEGAGFCTIASAKILLQLLFLSILSTGFAFACQTYVQSKIRAVVVSILCCAESLFAVVFSILAGYEKISVSLILGSLVLLASMVSASVGNTRNSLPELK